MYTRLTQIRKNKNMTMEKFGEILGVTKTTISRLEKGERNFTDQMIKSICREFDINEEWFRTGKGEMKLISSAEDEFTKYIAILLRDKEDFVAQKIKRFIVGYEKLDATDKKVVENLMRQIFEDEKKEQD